MGYLQGLLGYWADGFDFRAAERGLNRFDHYRVVLDGVRIHFVQQRASGGTGIPPILGHGWPSTFTELLPLVPLLTSPAGVGIDGPAFGVVIPSLPGYGFSERPARTGVNYRYVAGLFHDLMRRLGYERYAAGGGDFGSGVATLMALDDPGPLIGIHLTNLDIVPYTGPGARPLSGAERAYLAEPGVVAGRGRLQGDPVHQAPDTRRRAEALPRGSGRLDPGQMAVLGRLRRRPRRPTVP